MNTYSKRGRQHVEQRTTLSVIIPTCGRETLRRTLVSIINAGLTDNDEIVVVGDGPQPRARNICSEFRCVYGEYGPTKCYGNAQREAAIKMANKSHLMFIDDDDELNDNAISIIKIHVLNNPQKLHLYCMRHRNFGILWKEKRIRHCNVSTQMFVVPNVKSLIGHWKDKYEGDFLFIQETAKNFEIVWRPEIIAIQH